MPPIAGRSGALRRPTAQLLSVTALAVGVGAPAAGAQTVAGGTSADPAPVVSRIECRKACAGSLPQTGSVLRLRGKYLRDVVAVSFLGRKAGGDEVAQKPRRTSPTSVVVTVPPGAVRGRLVATDAEGAVSKPSPVVRLARPATLKSTGGPIATAVTGKKVYFDGERQPTLTFALETQRPANVVVQVVREADGAVVASFDQGVVQPGERRSVAWDGMIGGAEPPEGRYRFVVVAADTATGVTATSAQAGPRPADSFVLLGHRFPVRGRHDYGSHEAGFGGGRGHQGHDVFARCGTPLVAARGGTVKMKRWQDRAGHYIVIDGEQDDVDYAYMHLRDAALVDQGDRVRTGQLIGYVGDTGRAFGCHLHFEMWSAPGWYSGGSPFDPLPSLKAWDAVS